MFNFDKMSRLSLYLYTKKKLKFKLNQKLLYERYNNFKFSFSLYVKNKVFFILNEWPKDKQRKKA